MAHCSNSRPTEQPGRPDQGQPETSALAALPLKRPGCIASDLIGRLVLCWVREVTCPKRRCSRIQAGHAGLCVVPECPPGPTATSLHRYTATPLHR